MSKLLYILIKPACANLLLYTFLRSDYIYILRHINGEDRRLSSTKDVILVFARTRRQSDHQTSTKVHISECNALPTNTLSVFHLF